MSNISQLPSFALRRRTPGLTELGALLDQLPDAHLLLDSRSKRILSGNARAAELTAYSGAELNDLSFDVLFSHYDERAFWGKQSGETNHWEFTLIKRNKEPVEVRATCTELPSPKRWILVALTEAGAVHHQEEERQRQSQQWSFLQKLSAAPQEMDHELALELALQAGAALTGADCMFVYQADGQNLELRRCASKGAGLPELLSSQDLGHLRTPYLWTPGKRSLSILHRTARSAQFSFLASAPLGQPNALIGLVAIAGNHAEPVDQILHWMEILAAVITTILQHHAMISGLQEKIQKQQRALKMYEAAQEAVQDAMIVLSPDLRVLHMNRSAEEILGYRNQEVRGQPIEYILIGSENVTQALSNAKHGIPTYDQADSRLFRRSGQGFLVQINTLPVLLDDEVQGVVVLIQDLSEKEQIQVHAQQLEQRALLGEVTAVFAHEVRNPINNISTGLQLMALNLPDIDPNQEIIARLQQDCDRLAELMKSVLSYSHPSDYEMEPMDLGALITRMIERMRTKISRSKVKHHIQIEPHIPLILGNPRALEQVFTNLISNAVQAMGDQEGTLAIKIQSVKTPGRRGHVEVSVADSGPGIPKELLDRIFQPFFTTKPNGTGLGLAITRRIITAHKGILQVNSFPGGTVFSVQIPEIDPAANIESSLSET